MSSSSGTSVASWSRLRSAYRLVANGSLTRPVLRAQRLLVRLAEPGQRQRVGGDDLLGRLDRALALLDHVLDLVDDLVGQLVARPQHDDGGDRLAPLLVRGADHADLGDRGVLGDDVLDLAREHVEAAGDDHVLGPVDDVPEAVLVLTGHVAGVHPAVAERLGGLVRELPVAAAQQRAGHADLAGLALRTGLPSSSSSAVRIIADGRPHEDSRCRRRRRGPACRGR